MPKLPVVKARELVRVLTKLGFVKHHQVGSHAQFKDQRGRRITVSLHPSRELKRKTLKGIIDDLELTIEEFILHLKD